MIVYNVTVKIDNDLAPAWKRWMEKTHIPDVLATGCFNSATLFRIHDADTDGVTFAIQYRCPDIETFERYRANYASALQEEHSAMFQGRYVAFRTLLEKLGQFS